MTASASAKRQLAKGGFAPLSELDDNDAALYYGHLLAQAEISLPSFPRETQLALTWLAGEITHQGVRLWKAAFENIEVDGRDIGSWIITGRLAVGAAEPIALARRRWLREEGRQIIALAQPFLSPGQSRHVASKSLVDFCCLRLAADLQSTPGPVIIRDHLGSEIRLTARRKMRIKSLGEVFSIIKSVY